MGAGSIGQGPGRPYGASPRSGGALPVPVGGQAGVLPGGGGTAGGTPQRGPGSYLGVNDPSTMYQNQNFSTYGNQGIGQGLPYYGPSGGATPGYQYPAGTTGLPTGGGGTAPYTGGRTGSGDPRGQGTRTDTSGRSPGDTAPNSYSQLSPMQMQNRAGGRPATSPQRPPTPYVPRMSPAGQDLGQVPSGVPATGQMTGNGLPAGQADQANLGRPPRLPLQPQVTTGAPRPSGGMSRFSY